MARVFKALLTAALAVVVYVGIHYVCAWTLPLPAVGYTVVANLVAVGLVAVLHRRGGKPPAPPLAKQAVAACIGLGIGANCLVRLWMITVPFPEAWTTQYTERVQAVQQAPWWLLYTSTVLIAPLAEELVFRSTVYRALRNGFPAAVATVLSSVAFGMLHGTVVWILYTTALGILLAYIYEKTANVWGCVLCHMAFNIAGQLSFPQGTPPFVAYLVYMVGIVVFFWCLWKVYMDSLDNSQEI